jgi:Family of unknown function (DUF6390)
MGRTGVGVPAEPATPALEPVSGPLAFARFAAPPNVLGYCGGADSDALVGHLRAGLDDPELVELCRAFEGAWPYLRLIADSGGLADALDPRVVEAYWLGNGLLDRVPAGAFAADIELRFRARTAKREWPWLAGKPADGARPHHSFHVFEVMPRIGMLRDGQVAAILPSMEQCLVRPATVVSTGSGGLIVAVRPLILRDGVLSFGPPVERSVLDGGGTVRPGDPIAVHWGWSCGRLTPGQARRLANVTADALGRANQTV